MSLKALQKTINDVFKCKLPKLGLIIIKYDSHYFERMLKQLIKVMHNESTLSKLLKLIENWESPKRFKYRLNSVISGRLVRPRLICYYATRRDCSAALALRSISPGIFAGWM